MNFNVIYNKGINSVLRTFLKPFSKLLPNNLKFPVNGVFTVKGNNITPFKISTNPTNCVAKNLFWDNAEGFEFSFLVRSTELNKFDNTRPQKLTFSIQKGGVLSCSGRNKNLIGRFIS